MNQFFTTHELNIEPAMIYPRVEQWENGECVGAKSSKEDSMPIIIDASLSISEEQAIKLIDRIFFGISDTLFSVETVEGVKIVKGQKVILALYLLFSNQITYPVNGFVEACRGLKYSEFPRPEKRRINDEKIKIVNLPIFSANKGKVHDFLCLLGAEGEGCA